MANRAARRASAAQYGVWAGMVGELRDLKRATKPAWQMAEVGDRVRLAANWAAGLAKGRTLAGVGVVRQVGGDRSEMRLLVSGPHVDGPDTLWASNDAVMEIVN